MSIPTDEQIKKWQDRWDKYRELADQVVDILKGDRAVGIRESSKRMWNVQYLLISDIYNEEFEKLGEINFQHQNIPILDLRGIQLSFKDLSYVQLPYANLSGAIATDTNFTKADLRNSVFDGAYLDDSNFEKAKLQKSSFQGSDLMNTHFERAYLISAHFENTNLFSSHFEDTVLKRVHFDEAQFFETHLEGADFQFSFLEGAEFAFCHFSNKTRFIQASQPKESLLLQEQHLPTIFRQVKFLPSYTDCFGEKFSFRKSWRIFTLSFWDSFDKNKFWKLMNKYWFYTDFRLTNIEDADFSGAGDLKRYILDQQFLDRFKANHRIGYWIWNVFTNCGWSIWRVAFWSILLILFYAVIYGIPYPIPQCYPDWLASLLSNTIGIDPNFSLMNNVQILSHAPDLPRFWQLFYISFDIFTNLGIRTTFPMNGWGVFVMFTETVFGFVALGMLISVLTNRFARRS